MTFNTYSRRESVRNNVGTGRSGPTLIGSYAEVREGTEQTLHRQQYREIRHKQYLAGTPQIDIGPPPQYLLDLRDREFGSLEAYDNRANLTDAQIQGLKSHKGTIQSAADEQGTSYYVARSVRRGTYRASPSVRWSAD